MLKALHDAVFSRVDDLSAAMIEEYAAPSPSGTWDFQITLPVFLSSAIRVAYLPPGVHMSLSPSTSGDSL